MPYKREKGPHNLRKCIPYKLKAEAPYRQNRRHHTVNSTKHRQARKKRDQVADIVKGRSVNRTKMAKS